MTELNEDVEVEPLVIEPRPELLQTVGSPSGGVREENKPTTICLICGHVLFKKVGINIFLGSKSILGTTGKSCSEFWVTLPIYGF